VPRSVAARLGTLAQGATFTAILYFESPRIAERFDAWRHTLFSADCASIQDDHTMPKPPPRKLDVPPTPEPAPAETTPDAEPLTQVTPVPEKIGEGPGNLKAREQAFKRRTGAR
jgi:hypothetical protein